MNPLEAIHQALCNDQPAVLRQVLESHPQLKARVNETAGPFDSPIIHSARSREMLDVLLEAGADINARSKWWAGGFGILDTAPEELARYALTRGARVDAHSAARLGLIDELRQLVIAKPESVNTRGGDGKMPLHFASTVEVAQFLVDRGSDINARDIDHESTPAQHLIGEHEDVVRFLISKGCDVDIFLAAALGDLRLAERLISANPNCLRMRVNGEHFPMKNPRAGGTIYQWTLGFNVSPHEVARKFGRTQMEGLLMDRSPSDVQVSVHCWLGNEEGMRRMLDSDTNIVTQMQPSEHRQVADAARNNNTRAVQLMLEAGFPSTVYGQHHATPLHWAAWHGNVEMTATLLEHGAPLEDAANEFNATPLGWAIHGSEYGWHRKEGNYPEVVRKLLQAGAKVPARNDGTPEVREALRKK